MHGASGADVHRVIANGFDIALPDDGRSPAQLYGAGVYFTTSASRFMGCTVGSHRFFLCEVALGKSMAAQSSRPNLNSATLQNSGFDSLRAMRKNEEEGEEW